MSDYRFALVVMSDSKFRNPEEDRVRPIVDEILKANGFKLVRYDIIPDEFDLIKEKLIELSNDSDVDVVITSGGTGLYKRDVTPDATKEILDYEIPAIPQAILYNALTKTKRAMLSRMVAGVRNFTLIINLPGSPKAVKEDLEYIIDVIEHAVDKLKGDNTPCGEN
ncbi:MogA/MoaB family molybdenum cofactor biosynthesis protein [Hippea maritima]|uniref:Molybdenum cofactor synthesis domain protein n=1 Tax=Hippea maritima (strain ATCC 700847 / DSM 10411 / MH2) TaxID=760142 RepID=F2LXK7_HIPMA|nr:MogA/MoaB family molybdenum cofactor biosynthesis protein [Hippea maritima]AEA33193.1 molybdenum cofactor synthesis domain protein [Hippea maritima DSM 10411]